MIQNIDLVCGKPIAPDALAALRSRAFVYASLAPRAADVLRTHLMPIAGSEVAAYVDGLLVGYVALWPLHLSANNQAQNLTLLGPLMVDPAFQSSGLGSALMAHALAFADAQNLPPILLVGDAGYYERFGFQSGIASGWAMPGLAAPERLLMRPNGDASCLPTRGTVLPAFAPPSVKQTAA